MWIKIWKWHCLHHFERRKSIFTFYPNEKQKGDLASKSINTKSDSGVLPLSSLLIITRYQQ